jgi:hypothetical protein
MIKWRYVVGIIMMACTLSFANPRVNMPSLSYLSQPCRLQQYGTLSVVICPLPSSLTLCSKDSVCVRGMYALGQLITQKGALNVVLSSQHNAFFMGDLLTCLERSFKPVVAMTHANMAYPNHVLLYFEPKFL